MADMWIRVLVLALILLAGMPSAATAKPRLPLPPEPLPDIEDVLKNAGWTMTPELSAAYSQPGDIFDENNALLKKGEDCFDATVREGAYASMEVNRSLEAGVRMRVTIATVRGEAALEKKVLFDTPVHRQIPRLDLRLNAACVEAIEDARRRGTDTTSWYVITESLSAIIQKQQCGRYNAKAGTFMVAGSAEVQQACLRTSLEPVAVAFKVVPLSSLGIAAPVSATPQTAPEPAKQETGQYLSDLRELTAETDTAAKNEAKMKASLDAAEVRLLADAAAAWQLLEALGKSNPSVAAPRVQQFIDRFSAAKVMIEGPDGLVEREVTPPQIATARLFLKTVKAASEVRHTDVLGDHDVIMVEVPVQVSGGPRSGSLLVSDVEVGQGLYKAVMGEDPSYFSSCGEDCPVEQVSWYDAVKFCNRLSQLEGRSPAYKIEGDAVQWDKTSEGYRLLSSPEWKLAARSGKDDVYPGGEDVRRVAWIALNSDKRTHPSRDLKATGWKLWDLGGNVAEWVWSKSGHLPTRQPIRGGGWSSAAMSAMVDSEDWESPTTRASHIGFRIARTRLEHRP
jgi:formylglycine-generating enzyme